MQFEKTCRTELSQFYGKLAHSYALKNFHLHSPKLKTEETGFIEAQAGEAHVDFANNFIGGGVLRHGTVQEEIRFIIAPETLVSCLLCEQMNKSEAIFILGTQQYSNYTGYRNYFKYVPRDTSKEVVTRNSFGHYSSCIIAIDAIRYTRPEKQFIRALIDREIRKAYVGFAVKLPDELRVIATGNWGCGAFNGNLQLKFLIQLIAASVAGRSLHYFTFGDKKLIEKIRWFLNKLEEQNVSFNLLYKRMIEGRDRPHGDFILHPFEYLIERARSTATSPTNVDIPSRTTDDVSNSMEVDNESSLWKGNGRLATSDDYSPLWIGNGKLAMNDEPSTSNESLIKINEPINENRSKPKPKNQNNRQLMELQVVRGKQAYKQVWTPL
ncbi:Poly(ADP-ribose) glycohydrolase-like [Aphelenchoides bicaudatus]|nr:Poly(ADP-ribose) glycohydrolase-like [Aphelenchoides bicaudatus]